MSCSGSRRRAGSSRSANVHDRWDGECLCLGSSTTPPRRLSQSLDHRGGGLGRRGCFDRAQQHGRDVHHLHVLRCRPAACLLVTESLIMMRQNGQAAAMVDAPVASASSARSTLIRFPIFLPSTFAPRQHRSRRNARNCAASPPATNRGARRADRGAGHKPCCAAPVTRVVVGDRLLDRSDGHEPIITYQAVEQLGVMNDFEVQAELLVFPSESVEAVRAGDHDAGAADSLRISALGEARVW